MDKPAFYRIKVRGIVPECWEDRLGSMEVVDVKQKITVLEGWLPDQAALKGVLNTLYQLHLPLLELTCLKHNLFPQKVNRVRGDVR
jgi:hypothetical protein